MGHDYYTSKNGAPDDGFKLVGFSNFVRTNPRSDKFGVKRFHHVEFWCTDATNTARRFSWGLGMTIVAKSDLSTGNLTHASYLLRSGNLCFLFTAPYSPSIAAMESVGPTATSSIPTFDHAASRAFASTHGLGVRAIAVEVDDAEAAFHVSVSHGARPASPPVVLDGRTTLAEVNLYGDVVLRYVSYNSSNPNPQDSQDPDSWFLPKFEPVDELSSYPLDFGLRRLDHAVGNVPDLSAAVSYVKSFTGFHEFAEFTAEDVGTSESGLNSVVLGNNDEMVLLPMNEPVHGTKRKSQIQTYLEHNEGAGVQHLALVSSDIFRTLREMRKRSGVGGFEFMPSPPPTYYKNLKNRAGDVLTDEQIKECEELGILVDRDEQGTLLQIFTKPVGDRYANFVAEINNCIKNLTYLKNLFD
jgi:4-hydroxyphenylpyruvate dioxygenase